MSDLAMSTLPYIPGYRTIKSVGIFQTYNANWDVIMERLEDKAMRVGANGILDYTVKMDNDGFLVTGTLVIAEETQEKQQVTPCGRLLDL